MTWKNSKSAEEMMNILEAYDLTGSFRDVGELAGGVPAEDHTVQLRPHSGGGPGGETPVHRLP